MQKTMRSPGEAEAGYLAAPVQTSEEPWCMRERFTTYFVYNQQKQKMTTCTKASLSLLSGEFRKGGPVGIHFSVKRAFGKHIFCGTGRKCTRLPQLPTPQPLSLSLTLCIPLPFSPPPFLSHMCEHAHTHTHYIFICLLRIHTKLLGIRL